MIKIVVGGQLEKQRLADEILKNGEGKVTVEITSDIMGTLAVQQGKADYYFGACNTGAGGALGIAQGMLGPQLCVSVSIPGNVMSEDQLKEEVNSGKKLFGCVDQDIEKVVPTLIKHIIEKA